MIPSVTLFKNYRCFGTNVGQVLVQVKFTHTCLLKWDPSISKLGAKLSLEMPICKHPHMAEIPHDSGFVYGFLQFTLTEGLFFSLPMWADWFNAPAHFQIWREKLRGEFVSVFKIGDTKWAWLDYFVETLHFTSNLFWECRLLPESCRFWVTWCSHLFLNINVIWTVDT